MKKLQDDELPGLHVGCCNTSNSVASSAGSLCWAMCSQTLSLSLTWYQVPKQFQEQCPVLGRGEC